VPGLGGCFLDLESRTLWSNEQSIPWQPFPLTPIHKNSGTVLMGDLEKHRALQWGSGAVYIICSDHAPGMPRGLAGRWEKILFCFWSPSVHNPKDKQSILVHEHDNFKTVANQPYLSVFTFILITFSPGSVFKAILNVTSYLHGQRV
jgi:hypothetical protein